MTKSNPYHKLDLARKGNTPLISLDDAVMFVNNNFKNTEETLSISDELIDPIGMNMAIIADSVLKAGYMPNGFDQKDGYRIYMYVKE